MEVSKHAKQGTPVKDPKTPKTSKHSENSNPNTSDSRSPLTKSSKSAKSQKYFPKNPVVQSPRNKLRERKFVVVAKKKSKKEERSDFDCKCKEKTGGNLKKCLCVAYENLRASQEDFFKKKAETEVQEEVIEEKKVDLIDNQGTNSVSGSGKVMNLVKAFEKLLSTPDPKESEEEKNDSNMKNPLKRALPGLNLKQAEAETNANSLLCPSDFVLTAENLGLDRRFSVSSSWDGGRGSVSNRTSNGGRGSRRNSSESIETNGGRRWKKKQIKPTSQKPFKLRTEKRGKVKEEEFMKKLQEMMVEEEKQRIPIAQGLPWTTDEPEVLIKPQVKENTIPVDLRLHSDVRALERSEFDQQVAEKMSLIEQYKMERERQEKMAEEEEIKRLRKELVPKAQPMPFFDRPFLPRRSSQNPTMPKEPNFHMPQHKKTKSCISWMDMSSSCSSFQSQ